MVFPVDGSVCLAIALLAILQKIAAGSLLPTVKGTVIALGGLLAASLVTSAPPLFEGLFLVACLMTLVASTSPQKDAPLIPLALFSAYLILKDGWEVSVGLVLLSALLSSKKIVPNEGPSQKFSPFVLSTLADTFLLFGFFVPATDPVWENVRGLLLLAGIFIKFVLSSLIPSQIPSAVFVREAVLPIVALHLLFQTFPMKMLPHGTSLLMTLAGTGLVLGFLGTASSRSLPLILNRLFQGATALVVFLFGTGAIESAQTATLALLFLRGGAAMLSGLIAQIMSGETDIDAMGGLAHVTPKTCWLFASMSGLSVLFPFLGLSDLEDGLGDMGMLAALILFGVCSSAVLSNVFERIFRGECRAGEFVAAYRKEPPLVALASTLFAFLGAVWVVGFGDICPRIFSGYGVLLTAACLLGVLGRKMFGRSIPFGRLRLPLPDDLRNRSTTRVRAPTLPFVRHGLQFFFEKFYPAKTSSLMLVTFVLVSGTLYFIVLKMALM